MGTRHFISFINKKILSLNSQQYCSKSLPIFIFIPLNLKPLTFLLCYLSFNLTYCLLSSHYNFVNYKRFCYQGNPDSFLFFCLHYIFSLVFCLVFASSFYTVHDLGSPASFSPYLAIPALKYYLQSIARISPILT